MAYTSPERKSKKIPLSGYIPHCARFDRLAAFMVAEVAAEELRNR
jgi:hypothetical protein